MDFAFATILSICDGGASAVESFDTLRDIPRNGVPDIGVDFPLAPPPPLSAPNRFFGGRAFDIGKAGCAKHFPLGRVVEARVKLKIRTRRLHSPRRRRLPTLIVMIDTTTCGSELRLSFMRLNVCVLIGKCVSVRDYREKDSVKCKMDTD
jgi:hypothetical protein